MVRNLRQARGQGVRVQRPIVMSSELSTTWTDFERP